MGQGGKTEAEQVETLRLGDRLCLVDDGEEGGEREWEGGGFTILIYGFYL